MTEKIKLDNMKHLVIWEADNEEGFPLARERAFVEHYTILINESQIGVERLYHTSHIERNQGKLYLIYTDKGVLNDDHSFVEEAKRLPLEDIVSYKPISF